MQKQKLKLKLKLIFLLISVIGIALGMMGAMNFNNAYQAVLKNKIKELTVLRDLKIEKINTFFSYLVSDVNSVQESYNIRLHLPILTQFINDRSSSEYIQAENALDDRFKMLIKKWSLLDLILLNSEGRVIYTINKSNGKNLLGNEFPDLKVFEQGQIDIYYSDILKDSSLESGYSMMIAGPVYNFDGQFSGIIIFNVDMGPIYKMIGAPLGLGKSEETAVGRNEGDHAVYMHALKFDPQAAFQKKVYYTERKGLPMREATQGRSGAGLTIDYRGEPVIAAWQPLYVANQQWGLVTKMDQSEAFVPIEHLKQGFILIFVITLILSIIIAFVNAVAITEPLEKLTLAAASLAKGRFDEKVEGVHTKDEIGELAGAFNQMVYDLQKTTVARDELVGAQKALRESEEHYRSLFESIDEGFCIVQIVFDEKEKPIDFRYLQVNPSFEKQSGLKNVTGKTIKELVPQIEDQWVDIFGQVALKGEPARFENRAEQLHRWYDVYAFRSGESEKLQVAILFTDITSRKQAEQELARSNKDLEQFAYVASHDLQEPLRMVASFCQKLEKKYSDQLDETAKEYIHFAVDGAKRMQHLVDALLMYARVGKKEVEYEKVDLNHVIHTIKKDFELRIQETSAFIKYDSMPVIQANAIQMHQLFQNLISNGLKFKGKNDPVIVISGRKINQSFEFMVKDNGIGIAEEYFHKLFVIFQRLNPREEYPGTGIGLALCKKIVENYGGKIWVESKPGEGTAFYFTLHEKESEV